ncbi:uncharacterized protein [Asterias amurensis]|uniref:uncharacterized protein n=1 Tax=Asterias amurensis TaxID=7602 RepID=UPI003AB36195
MVLQIPLVYGILTPWCGVIDYALVGRNYTTKNATKNQKLCYQACLKDSPRCRSANYRPKDQECDLNCASHFDVCAGGRLVEQPGSLYIFTASETMGCDIHPETTDTNVWDVLDNEPSCRKEHAELDIVGKPTEQSSDYDGKYTSDKAVDGSHQDNLIKKNLSCSHTGKENAPWWRVDLEDAYTISKVTILNRGDCCNNRLTGAAVRAGMCGGEVTNNRQCGSSVTSEQAAVPGATIEFVCDPPLRARFVSVDLQSRDGEYLQLCEVTVEQVL